MRRTSRRVGVEERIGWLKKACLGEEREKLLENKSEEIKRRWAPKKQDT